MSGVRVLVGTRKGAFMLTADAEREQWDVGAARSVGSRAAADRPAGGPQGGRGGQ